MKKTISYKGFKIAVTSHSTRFGILYHAENNIGEPYAEYMEYSTEEEAVNLEKKNIDMYLEETNGNYKKN